MTVGELWRRTWYVLNRSRIERELHAEMAAHRGKMADPARFGNLLKLREETRDVWGWTWLDQAWQDARGACRVLSRSRGFAITACLILTAGIGLNLMFFQLFNVTMLQPLAVRDPGTLVRFDRRSSSMNSNKVPYPAIQCIRHHNDVLAAVLVLRDSDVTWDEEPGQRFRAAFVSANWFSELGCRPVLGRLFSEAADETAQAATPVVVVSERFWRARLQSAPDVVGRAIRLNGRLATIAGVVPADFPGLTMRDPQIWLLIDQVGYFEPGNVLIHAWDSDAAELYARLRPGVSAAAAQQGLASAIREIARAHPAEFHDDEWLDPSSGRDRFRNWRDRRKMLTIASLVGALTLLVLMVASANLGNLVLSRSIGRLREFSLRAALGASRARILRQLSIESGVLAGLGSLGGIAAAWWSARLLAAQTPMPAFVDFTPDWRTLAAAATIGFIATAAFGLAPAWMVSRKDLVGAMKDGGQQTSAGLSRARFRLALIAIQVAGCCALLVVAGALVRGLQRQLAADPGFKFEQVAVLDPELTRHGIAGEAARAYWTRVKTSISAYPEVAESALVLPAPLGDTISQAGYRDVPSLRVAAMNVEPEFFRLLEIPIVAGRAFVPTDGARTTVIISRHLALAMYGTLDVVGQRFPASRPSKTIVGVSGDAPTIILRGLNGAEQYTPLEPASYADAALLVRARGNPAVLLKPMEAAARTADLRVLPRARLLRQGFEERLREPRLASLVAALTGLLVLTLACLGIFGVVAYNVMLRTKEIGIRRALGADRGRIFELLLRQLAWPAGLGTLCGTMAGLLAATLLEGRPFYLASTDVTAPTGALVVVGTTGIVAALVPALRAMTIDPLRALRHE